MHIVTHRHSSKRPHGTKNTAELKLMYACLEGLFCHLELKNYHLNYSVSFRNLIFFKFHYEFDIFMWFEVEELKTLRQCSYS